jgi:transglutaminase-like putative cysteine protease
MRDLVLAATRSDPKIRDLAMTVSTGFAITGPVDAARSVENLARSSFILVDEPEELLIDPSVQFEELADKGVIHGDCDDVALFVAALLYNIGVQTRFKAVTQGDDGTFQHVFVEYKLKGLNRWIPVDATIHGIPVYDKGDWIAEEI